jgi:hypothetical protein
MSRIAEGLLGAAVQKTAFAKIAKGGGLGSEGTWPRADRAFLKAWRRSLMRIKLSGPNSVMLFGAERQGMVLGGGASSPVAKEGPLSSGGLFHFAV